MKIKKRKKPNIFYRMYARCFQFFLKIAVKMLPIRTPQVLGDTNEIVPLLKEKNIGSVLIVTDPALYALGMTARIEASLSAAGIGFAVYKDTQQNPTIENVEKAREQYEQNHCAAVIAVGGGSAIDCAKAAAARVVKPKKPVAKMAGLLKILKRIPPFFAVPTTAGTGSEATLAAVITDENTHRKFAINDFSLVPHYAVLDAKLTADLPKNLTAYTGMDALTHAVEAYIGGSNSKGTRRDAELAFRLIKENMLKAYENGGDLEARKNMLTAAHYAGRAFTKAYVGNIHAAAHTLSGFYGVQHGLANAVLMPHVLAYYGNKAHKKLAKIAAVMDIGTELETAEERAEALIGYIRDLNAKMGIPEKIAGIRDEDLPQMIKNALKEANPLYPVPIIFGKDDFRRIFETIRG